MRELICIIELIKDIQSFSIYWSTQNPKYFNHSKSVIFDDIPPSNVYVDNEYFLKFYTITTMYPRTKHNALTYHFFWSKVEALKLRFS